MQHFRWQHRLVGEELRLGQGADRLLALVFGEPAGGEVLREGLTGSVECLLAGLGVKLPASLLVVFRGLSHVSSASYRVLSDSTLSFLSTYQ